MITQVNYRASKHEKQPHLPLLHGANGDEFKAPDLNQLPPPLIKTPIRLLSGCKDESRAKIDSFG